MICAPDALESAAINEQAHTHRVRGSQFEFLPRSRLDRYTLTFSYFPQRAKKRGKHLSRDNLAER